MDLTFDEIYAACREGVRRAVVGADREMVNQRNQPCGQFPPPVGGRVGINPDLCNLLRGHAGPHYNGWRYWRDR